MAVTKILASHSDVKYVIDYVLRRNKTEKLLTDRQLCTIGNEATQMNATKEQYGKQGGVTYYHIVQSFAPKEVSPEMALTIAREFVREHLQGYEVVMATHVDRDHVHSHIVFNSVNYETGKKYDSNAKTYYGQVRKISDRLCAEHGLSVIMEGSEKAMSYIEWLKIKGGYPTFRTMLESDLRRAIDDANDFGHFLMLMEHMGYEIKHGNRLGFRLRGTGQFMIPERKNAMFSEDGIRKAIEGNLEAIEQGLRPVFTPRRAFTPFKKRPKLKGFYALYVHYLYVLGKIKREEYPPKMTAKLKAEVMKFEQYKEQFQFLHRYGITTEQEMSVKKSQLQAGLQALTKQRTIINVAKKKRKSVFDALATAEALHPAKALYENGVSGMEGEYREYLSAVKVLENAGVSVEKLLAEKAEVYEKVATINREIKAVKRDISLCDDVMGNVGRMEKQMDSLNKQKIRDKMFER